MSALHPQTRAWIERLDLCAHPEGGHYREVFRSPRQLALEQGQRSALTAIHFVLDPGEVSMLHRVRSDEIWCFQEGGALDLELLTSAGERRTLTLGRDGEGQLPLAVVPAGDWQAAAPRGPGPSWCSCFVAPGFDFADFEMAQRAAFLERWPDQADLAQRFTQEPLQ